MTTQTPDAVREALTNCRDQFAFYAREHTAAGKSEKAATNARFAKIADDALAALDSRAGDAGEGFGAVLERWDSVIPLSHDERAKLIAELTAAAPAPAVDAVPAGEVER